MTADSGLLMRWLALITGSFVLQVVLFDQINIFGVHPEFMLLIAIAGGMVGGPERGSFVGFGSGLLVDLTLHGTFGVSALCYTIVGFLVGLVRESLPGSSRTLSLIMTLVASSVGVVLYATVTQLLGGHTFSDPNYRNIVAIVSLWNALMCLPVLSLSKRTEGTRAAF